MQILADRGAPRAFGYKDALDKLVACGGIAPSLARRLGDIMDVTERMPSAWSSVHEQDLQRVIDVAPAALRELADVCERHLGLDAGAGEGAPA